MATNPYDLAAVRKAAQQKRSVVSAMKARIRELEAELAEALEKTDKLVLEAQRGEKVAVDKLVDLRRELVDARAELQVRDDMGDEVLRILREATGKRDFHSEMEAAEHAAKLLAEARRDGARLDCVLRFMNDQRQFWLFLYLHKTKLQTTRGDADLDEWRKWIDAAMEGK